MAEAPPYTCYFPGYGWDAGDGPYGRQYTRSFSEAHREHTARRWVNPTISDGRILRTDSEDTPQFFEWNHPYNMWNRTDRRPAPRHTEDFWRSYHKFGGRAVDSPSKSLLDDDWWSNYKRESNKWLRRPLPVIVTYYEENAPASGVERRVSLNMNADVRVGDMFTHAEYLLKSEKVASSPKVIAVKRIEEKK